MRRIIIVLFLALYSQSLFSQNLVSLDPSKSLEIRAGDVILLPLYCYTCEILESETGSPFSHSGVVLEDESGDLVVAEALGDTHWVPLAEFLGRTEKEKMAGLYRPKEFHFLWARDPEGFSKFNSFQPMCGIFNFDCLKSNLTTSPGIQFSPLVFSSSYPVVANNCMPAQIP